MSYYQKNRLNRLEYQKQYYQENKQRIKEYTHNYYEKNKDTLKYKRTHKTERTHKRIYKPPQTLQKIIKNITIIF